MAESYLDPEGLSLVARMELVARQVVEGFLSGRHPSPYHGSSVEYVDHRPYAPGDEIRSIDWKLWAKIDRYFVKLAKEQTNTRCTILLDTSRSMEFGSERAVTDTARPNNKFEYGCYLSACLAYLMLRQNDAVGLALFDSGLHEYLPARSKGSHFRIVLERMAAARPDNDTRIGEVMHELARRLQSRGIVIIISDLLGDLDALADGLAHFRHRSHEVIVFHVMDPDELNFPYERITRFRDAEGTSRMITQPRFVRARYLERLEEFLRGVKQSCLERGASYQFARTDYAYQQLLLAYLEQRARAKV
ncbi:MAG: DUF58 domain-containing protein [Planctomycetota bacterium]|jgi:uncharacterized protein (DUF58 family)|nr:DUF58 domain-containing protein [Planctomycetota bacterium]